MQPSAGVTHRFSTTPSIVFDLALESVYKAMANLPKDIAAKRDVLAKQYEIVLNALTKTAFPQQPTKEVALLLAEILTQYGQSLYAKGNVENCFSESKEFLFASLHLQKYALGLEVKIVNLASLLPALSPVALLARTHHFHDLMHQTLCTSRHETILSKVQDANLSSHQVFVLAYTLRWINGCYNNLPKDPKATPQQILERKENTLELAQALLTLHHNPETDLELRELRYNDLPGYFQAAGKMDLYEQNWAILKEEGLEKKDRAFLVRVYNKISCSFESPADILPWQLKALEQYNLMSSEERNPELYNVFLSNHSSTLIKIGGPENLEKAKKMLDEAYGYVTAERAIGNENHNFRYISLNYARYQIRHGDIDNARLALDRLHEVLLKSLNDTDSWDSFNVLKIELVKRLGLLKP